MADPVEEKSSFLTMYMSSHPDTLVAYAKWYGKVQEPIQSAEMTFMSTKIMDLKCTLRNGYQKSVTISFDPPLNGYEDVKPRLLEMKSLAQEGLGMIRTPKITSFGLPFQAVYTTILVSSLAYISLFPVYASSASSEWFTLFWTPAKYAWSVPYLGVAFQFMAASVAFVHCVEILYVANLCRKHTGFLHGIAYILSVTIAGMPVMQDLRKKIQQARIDSVMKVE